MMFKERRCEKEEEGARGIRIGPCGGFFVKVVL